MAVATQPPVIPEAFLVRCEALPPAEDGALATLMQNHVEVARLYHLCAQRHDGLVEVIRGTQGK